MVESLRDNLPPKEERCFRRCAVRWDEMRKYKQLVGNMIDYQDFRKLSREKWGELCFNSVCRLNCLINDTYETPSREEFIEKMGQGKIYHMQKEKWISKGKVMVLNSVPLFLLEYFRGEFWDQYI